MRLRILGTSLALLSACAAGIAGRGVAAIATHPSLCRKATRAKDSSEQLRRPPQTIDRSDHLQAVVKTNCGRFTIKLDANRSPVVVNSFAYLVRSGFYDGLSIDRVARNFVIQGGDSGGNGFGGPGYHVVEPPPPRIHYRTGVVAMSKAASNPSGWSGSDFFVVLGHGGAIAPQYAVLGDISSGWATIRRIGRLATPSERPSQVVRFDWVRIRRTGHPHQGLSG